MHEASLMTDLMRRVTALAEQKGAIRVSGLQVWLGALSHFSPEHFREHFQQAAQGTIAEDATLNVTLSHDITHKDAQSVMLQSIEVEV
jgi:hydrogenase nickel incorporation protein HypA/HybF